MRGSSLTRGTVLRIRRSLNKSHQSEEWSRKPGLLQALDPRVKILGLLVLVLPAAWTRELSTLAAIFVTTIVLAAFSRISVATLARRAWLPVLIFTGAVAVPALFLVPGTAITPSLPWAISHQGLRSATFLLFRAECTASLSALLILTTPWTHVLKGLRILRVPVLFVVILSMTYRYILLLLQTARELFEARESRRVGRLDGAQGRHISMGIAGVLLGKTLHLSEEVYAAMRSRGYRGEVYLIQPFRMRAADWFALTGVIAGSVLLVRGG